MLTKCRQHAYRKMPYLADAILSLIPVECPGKFSASKDWHLYYDPKLTEDVEEGAWRVARECLGLVLKHYKRAENIVGDNQWETWRLACDLSVYNILKDCKFQVPSWHGKPQDYGLPSGLSVEEYFRLLSREEDDEAKGSSNKPVSGAGGNNLQPGGGEDVPGPSDETTPAGNQVDHGSSTDGLKKEWETKEGGIEEYESDVIRHSVEQKSRGAGHGKISDEFERIIRPKADPRRVLMSVIARYISEIRHGKGWERSYRRPSRRPGIGGLIKPSKFEAIPKILFVIDTSGSMSQKEVALGAGLVAKCISSLSIRDGVKVICGDTEKQWAKKVFDPSKIQIKGRGGTDMGRIINEALEEEPYDVVFCVTDGYTPWPSETKIPVVACLTSKQQAPSWIKSIQLE